MLLLLLLLAAAVATEHLLKEVELRADGAQEGEQEGEGEEGAHFGSRYLRTFLYKFKSCTINKIQSQVGRQQTQVKPSQVKPCVPDSMAHLNTVAIPLSTCTSQAGQIHQHTSVIPGYYPPYRYRPAAD